MPDAVAFSARAQRRQHRDSYTEWIQVALLVGKISPSKGVSAPIPS